MVINIQIVKIKYLSDINGNKYTNCKDKIFI
jgi:hypothetical protein